MHLKNKQYHTHYLTKNTLVGTSTIVTIYILSLKQTHSHPYTPPLPPSTHTHPYNSNPHPPTHPPTSPPTLHTHLPTHLWLTGQWWFTNATEQVQLLLNEVSLSFHRNHRLIRDGSPAGTATLTFTQLLSSKAGSIKYNVALRPQRP